MTSSECNTLNILKIIVKCVLDTLQKSTQAKNKESTYRKHTTYISYIDTGKFI